MTSTTVRSKISPSVRISAVSSIWTHCCVASRTKTDFGRLSKVNSPLDYNSPGEFFYLIMAEKGIPGRLRHPNTPHPPLRIWKLRGVFLF